MKDLINETAWRRGWDDTKAAWTHWPFIIISSIISVALFIFGLLVLAWYWGVLIVVIAVFGVWIYQTLSAPYKQRNEARKLVNKIESEGILKLKGKFFHDFDEEGYVQHQGHIVDIINDEIISVEYFDWVVGQPSITKILKVKDITDNKWAIYSTDEEMRDAWEHGHVKRRR